MRTEYGSKAKISLAIISFLIFVAISYLIVTRETLVFDTVIREVIYGHRNEGLTFFFTMITYLGNWQTITLICCLFLTFPQTRIPAGLLLSITAILSTSMEKALKITFHRQRPDLTLHLIQQGGHSFPSGHSMTSLVFYGMIIFLCQKNIKNKTITNIVTVLLVILIFLIGFSRIYLGVHYPTDVLGGWAIGICLLIILTSTLSL